MSEEQPTKSTPRAYLILATCVALALGGIGAFAFVTRHHQSTDDAQVEADVAALAVRIGGLVTRVHIEENQPVKAGDLIMELDEADQAAMVRQAEAEVASAHAQAAINEAQVSIVEASAKGGLQSAQAVVSGSSTAVTSANTQILAARAAVARSQADFKRAELDFLRAQKLFSEGATTQERLDNTKLSVQSTQASLEGAVATLEVAESAKVAAQTRVREAQGHLGQMTPIEAQIASARAAVDYAWANVHTAEARLEQQKLNFGYLKVVAPIDGIVSRLSAHAGQLLSHGQLVAEIVPHDMYVVANYKETQIGAMQAGQPAEVTLDTFDDHPMSGRVESLSGGTGARFSLLPPDNASGNFVKVTQRVPVRIKLDRVPQNLSLRAGLSAAVTVYTDR